VAAVAPPVRESPYSAWMALTYQVLAASFAYPEAHKSEEPAARVKRRQRVVQAAADHRYFGAPWVTVTVCQWNWFRAWNG
jgi:hypothetical protein